MKVVLNSMMPDYRRSAMPAFGGTAILLVVSLLDAGDGITGFLLKSGIVWLLILLAPLCHVGAYLGFRYFHLTSRIKSVTARKVALDSFRFFIITCSYISLIYVELECDEEGVKQLVGCFSGMSALRLRLDLLTSEEGGKRIVLRLFSDEKILRKMSGK